MNIQHIKQKLKNLHLPKESETEILQLLHSESIDAQSISKIASIIEKEVQIQEELQAVDLVEQTMYEDLLTQLQTLSIQLEANQEEALAEELEKALEEINNLSGDNANHTPISQN